MNRLCMHCRLTVRVVQQSTLSHIHESDRGCNIAHNVNLDRQHGGWRAHRGSLKVDQISIGFGDGPELSEGASKLPASGSGWGTSEYSMIDHFASLKGTRSINAIKR